MVSAHKSLSVLHAEAFKKIPWLVHGLSTRTGGVSKAYGGGALNLGFTNHDTRVAVERNRIKFIEAVGAGTRGKAWPIVTLRQIHSDIIHYISRPPKTQLIGDGLITDAPQILIAVQTADCLPVILVDVKHRAAGVFHAGWRGTVKRIVQKGAGMMRFCFGTKPADIKAAIGPGIHNCCYEVGPELREQFESQFECGSQLFHEVQQSDPVREKYPLLFLTARAPGHSDLPKKVFLDLVEANRRQLIELGVHAKNISASPLCTACNPELLFSHRAEKGVTGRMMAVAGVFGK